MEKPNLERQQLIYQAAKKYLKLNFSIIPARHDKRAIIPWETYQKEAADEAQIDEWWKPGSGKYAGSNIGNNYKYL